MKKFLGLLAASVMMFAMICGTAFAAGIENGCTAYVKFDSMNVTKNPTPTGTIDVVYKGNKLTVLEAYINGKDKKTDNYHKVQLQNGTVGYVYAYANRTDTLEIAEAAEKKYEEETKPSDETKYQHGINMYFLSDYIYGGSKATDGENAGYGYAKVPDEWTRHRRPASLPLVGKAILHIGDNGKEGMVRASFYPDGYPGSPGGNYHSRRLDELITIGYFPIGSEYSRNNANWAFFNCTSSELDVVAYDENWVAVWSDGGVDTSRGLGAPCGGTPYIPYGSWKPGVYFFPRKYCYILDINNQLAAPPAIAATGKAAAALMVKTTPDANDYVKSGVYKINQTFQIIDPTPINGHYKIYYRHGVYYVDADYVNVKLANTKKPIITYTAEVNADSAASKEINIYSSADVNSASAAKAKTGTVIDVIQKDYNASFAKVWFNSKECYVETKYLTNFQTTPSGSGIAQLGQPIGVMVIDSPWRAYGEYVYSPEAFELYKQCNYGNGYASAEFLKNLMSSDGAMSKMEENDWANVYKIEDITYVPDPEFPDETEKAKIYTIVFDGNVRYLFKGEEEREAFSFYPGNGYSKNTTANTQGIYVDTTKYDVLAYNINDNNYFKLRDIAKMLSGTAKTFDITFDAATNSIDMVSFYDYDAAGGELAPGDGEVRTAYASSAFLTYDGIPIKATCYNINGNNYFKLRDITDALDCRVEWDGEHQLIKIITTVPAYDDPNEPVG